VAKARSARGSTHRGAFRCGACGAEHTFRVTAQSRSSSETAEDARELAEDAIKLARCPTCGRRDVGAVRSFVLMQLGVTLVVGAVFGGGGLLQGGPDVGLAAAVVCTAIAAVIALLRWRKMTALKLEAGQPKGPR
jgi:hypothetical protein